MKMCRPYTGLTFWYHAWRVEELAAAMAVRMCGSPKVANPIWRSESVYGPTEPPRAPCVNKISAARKASV